ncbi:TPA: hypothetical protein SLG40_001628 [Serratia odorifera]|nr:hypothetical protein [Serratia odorifera]
MIEQYELRFGAFSVYVLASDVHVARMNLEGVVQAIKTGQPCYVTGDTLEGFGEVNLDDLVN